MNRLFLILMLIGYIPSALGSDEMSLSWRSEDVGNPGVPWLVGRLTVQHPMLPSGQLEMTYPEAFCRSGSTNQSWKDTVIQQKARIIHSKTSDIELHLLSEVGEHITVEHVVRVDKDGLDFAVKISNDGEKAIDLEWAQTACLHVGSFTGLTQSDYFKKCFIFTEDGLTLLPSTYRETKGYYTPEQVYVPKSISSDDVNPRPISRTRPTNGLIGCFSADDTMILATAWEPTHELFQGVLTCIHNDPHIGGIEPGEVKRIRGKVYIMKNDAAALLRRYNSDFPSDPSFRD
ncbi:MAG: hypothetical protein VCD00_09495 [Candidatus Hydrogenedentota bacterium]